MKRKHNHHLVLNWIFIFLLLVLIINDHYFKWEYHNWLTGKLSDFAGLLLFPMFLQYIFPKAKYCVILTGLLFIFWKLPISDRLINFYNRVTFIPVQRTVDYTDFIALIVLPLSHFFMGLVENFSIKGLNISFHPIILIVPCSLVFMATSPPLNYRYSHPGGDVHIGKEYKIKLSKNEILAKLENEGFVVTPDTALNRMYSGDAYYIIENAVFEKDTIPKIRFAIHEVTKQSLLLMNDVTIKGDVKITDWRTLKRFSKIYRKLIKETMVEELK